MRGWGLGLSLRYPWFTRAERLSPGSRGLTKQNSPAAKCFRGPSAFRPTKRALQKSPDLLPRLGRVERLAAVPGSGDDMQFRRYPGFVQPCMQSLALFERHLWV